MAIDTLAGNSWGTGAQWVSNSVPIDADTVALTETLTGALVGLIDQGGVYLNTLHVTPSCAHVVGSTTSPLIISAKLLTIEGQAGFHMAGEATTPGDDVLDCRVDCATPSVPVTLTSDATAANWDQIVVSRGNVTIGAAMSFDVCRLEVGYHNKASAANDATVNISPSSAGDTLPTVFQVGGILNSSVLVTDATIMGGKYTQIDKAVTTCIVGAGGEFVYKNGTASTIATLRILPGGTADFTQTFGETTITTLWLHPGGTIIGANQGPNAIIEGSVVIGANGLHDLGGRWLRSKAA